MPKPTRMDITITVICQTNGRRNIALLRYQIEFARFMSRIQNAVTTSFLYVLPSPCGHGLAPLPARLPVALEWGFGDAETTVQKYKLFPIWQKKIQTHAESQHRYLEIACLTRWRN